MYVESSRKLGWRKSKKVARGVRKWNGGQCTVTWWKQGIGKMATLSLLMYKTALTPQLPVAMRNTKDDPLKNPRFKAVHDGWAWQNQGFYCTGSGRRGTDVYWVWSCTSNFTFGAPVSHPFIHRIELDDLCYYMPSVGLWIFACILSLNSSLNPMRLINNLPS